MVPEEHPDGVAESHDLHDIAIECGLVKDRVGRQELMVDARSRDGKMSNGPPGPIANHLN